MFLYFFFFLFFIGPSLCVFFFFFNDTATTEIYTLSLHDALPISRDCDRASPSAASPASPSVWRTVRSSSCRSAPSTTQSCATQSSAPRTSGCRTRRTDRKSTRLNSSHDQISYAVFCLKKKKHTHP